MLRFFFLECVPDCPWWPVTLRRVARDTTQCLREDGMRPVAYLVVEGLLLLGALNLGFYPVLQMMGKPRYFILGINLFNFIN